jgi:error-prone DNA polymerase
MPILSDTLGAIVFQDQVIQVAMALAGFSAGEAEGLRRAMSRKRSEAALRAYRDRFISGAVEHGTERAVAERVYEQVEGFSGFGFPKSHAAAFALLGYQAMWLRVHYGAEFLCALLNEQPMGFYPPDALAHEAQRRGIEVLGADVNRSGVECSVEVDDGSPGVRIGLGYVKGVAEEEARALVAERERGGRYAGLAELTSRSGMGRDGLERLAWAGACRSLGVAAGAAGEARRRDDLWRLGVARGAERTRGRDHAQLSLPLPLSPAPELRPLDSWEHIVADYASTGVTLGDHPMQLLRAKLDDGVATSADLQRLPHASEVTVAGLVVARQRPATARGVVFMLFEDEHGVVNLIVPPPTYERCRMAVRTAALALARGRLERREGVTNVVADSVERLQSPSARLAEVRHIEPPVERETGRDGADEVAAVAPRAHSFGRRG